MYIVLAIVKIALGFTLCNHLTVTHKIILYLYSNACDYLYLSTASIIINAIVMGSYKQLEVHM